ncbi:MAG: HAD family hydrolase [Lachnospiraceae bacterium]|nr:HAD family hydrolase [Lachnospiraceae bacterium]
MYKNILFDLDGTLTDPGLGITNSVMYALRRFDIHAEDRAALYKFIGPPLRESFEVFYGFSREKSEMAIRYYREYFSERGLYENEVYDGIESLLNTLKERGKTLLVATSKPEVYAVRILKHFKLYDYFDFVAGATMDSTRNEKADIIKYALQSCRISEKSSTVMVGDRKHDVIGARENGLDSIGVLFGYGNADELKDAGAAFLAEKPEDILGYVCTVPK